ncbi:hypothetical protein BC835DRAFT_494376 [Cytidiella melzeri]|nr:hypothetical protein BC835DRAFT_494376 [Cytidiella melzeri]
MIQLTAQANWRAAGHEVGLMKETVSALVQTISESAVVLDSHVDQAVLANRMQVETTEAVSRLGTVLTGLVSSTRTEMEKINDTAVAVRDQWLAASSMQVHFFDWQRWSNWSQCGLLWLLQILFKVDSVVLERVFGSPLLQLTSVICRVVWYIICSSLTSVTSILLLVTSWKHWVLPRETVVDTEESAGYPAEPEKRRIRPQPRVVTCSPSSQAGSRSHVAYARFSRIPDRLCRTSTD